MSGMAQKSKQGGLRIAVDIGGTFTDLAAFDESTGELHFGTQHYAETRGWIIEIPEFWKLCASAPRAVYVFVRESDMAQLGWSPEHADCVLQTTARYGNTLLMEKIIP